MPFVGAMKKIIAKKSENGYKKNVRMVEWMSINIPQMFYKGSKFQVVCDNHTGIDGKARSSWNNVHHPGVGNRPTLVRNDAALFPFQLMETAGINREMDKNSVRKRVVL